ncbi:Auxin-induced in root cultures protein 12 [Hordeum vulgare]|nr:Auxin-induced in root cultures protein 12 [Hordeum vulgare]
MSFSFGSAGSATNKEELRSSGTSKPDDEDEIPQRVDAHDNFEHDERPGSDAADQSLAKEVHNMRLRLEKEKPGCSKVQQMAAKFEAQAPITGSVGVSKQRKKKSGLPKKGLSGRRPGNLVIRDEPLGSEDMIPAIRGLGSLDATNAMVPFVDVPPGGIQKRRKVDNQQTQVQWNNVAEELAGNNKRTPVQERVGRKQTAGMDVRWVRPPPGWTKLNTDGAFTAEQHTGGAGMILRSDNGQVIFSSCRYLLLCSSAIEAELVACMEFTAYDSRE